MEESVSSVILDHSTIGGMMRAIVLLASLALAGCQTKTLQEMSYTETKDVFGRIHQRCTEQGIAPNSPERDACIKQELTKEDATRRLAATRERSAVMCQTFNGVTMCQ